VTQYIWLARVTHCSFNWGTGMFENKKLDKKDTKSSSTFRLVPAHCNFYMEIYNWDGQTVLSAYRLFQACRIRLTRGME
jgi:hypothetical protein